MALRLRSLPWAVSLGLVLGGALGNLIDRIFRAPGPFVGHVVDMISLFDPYGQVWPVFNLADSSLVCGVLLAVLLELTGRQRDGRRAGARRRPGRDDATPRHRAAGAGMTSAFAAGGDHRSLPVPDGLDGMRLDQAVSRLFGLSRTAAAALVDAGDALVDGVRPAQVATRSRPAPGWR